MILLGRLEFYLSKSNVQCIIDIYPPIEYCSLKNVLYSIYLYIHVF